MQRPWTEPCLTREKSVWPQGFNKAPQWELATAPPKKHYEISGRNSQLQRLCCANKNSCIKKEHLENLQPINIYKYPQKGKKRSITQSRKIRARENVISCQMEKVQKTLKYGVEKSEVRGPNARRAFATRRLKIPNCSLRPSADEDGATKQRKKIGKK